VAGGKSWPEALMSSIPARKQAEAKNDRPVLSDDSDEDW